MRRYSPATRSVTLGKIMVFFGAWNILGMTVYKYIIKREEEKEPGQWKNSTGVQQYLRFVKFGSENVKKITLKGFSSVTTEELTPEDVQKLKGYSNNEYDEGEKKENQKYVETK